MLIGGLSSLLSSEGVAAPSCKSGLTVSRTGVARGAVIAGDGGPEEAALSSFAAAVAESSASDEDGEGSLFF